MVKVMVAAIAILGAGGCRSNRDRDEAYAKGWNAGHEAGVAEGRTDGLSEAEAAHQGKWGLIGLLVGGVIGAAAVAVATRKHLGTQWRKRRRRKALERKVGACRVDLDPGLHAEVLAIALKKEDLVERLAMDDGPLIAVLRDRLGPEFIRLDQRLLDIAALLQELRELRDATVLNSKVNPPPLPSASSAGSQESIELATLRRLQEQRRIELVKNAENIVRCESQLAGLATFLDELVMRLGNLKVIEQAEAFDRVEQDLGEEIDALGAGFETTLARLTRDG